MFRLETEPAFSVTLWAGYEHATVDERNAYYKKHRLRFQKAHVKEPPAVVLNMLHMYEVSTNTSSSVDVWARMFRLPALTESTCLPAEMVQWLSCAHEIQGKHRGCSQIRMSEHTWPFTQKALGNNEGVAGQTSCVSC